MEYISDTIFSIRFKVQMNTDFRRCDISATAFNSGEQVLLPILYLLRMMKRFFCHYFPILPQNPHYTSSHEYFNKLQTVTAVFRKQQTSDMLA